jgi:3-hydroxyisobutyrate dehydrogenase
MRIAFIGLGNMGGGMAANLVKAGHKVFAFDLSQDALNRAKDAGCEIAATANEAVKDVNIVVSMLPAGAHVLAVYTGENGILANAPKGTLFLDCSTIDIESARTAIKAAIAAGHEMCDAPVSGGVGAANAGTLTFMVGGNPASFEKAKPILEAMGKKIFHAGDAGNGQAAKICNNMLLGITMVGTCEAFSLAKKLGLDAQTFFDISSVSSGQNWSMTSYCPVAGPVATSPANNDYKAGFAAGMMLKDLRLANEAAIAAKAAIPMGAMAGSLYSVMEQLGKSNEDFSAIIKIMDSGII